MRVLFVCNLGRDRSRTAAEVFSKDFETDYAGLFSHDHPVTREQVLWAEVVCVMDGDQEGIMRRKFTKELAGKRLVDLEVPNGFVFGEPALVEELTRTITQAHRLA